MDDMVFDTSVVWAGVLKKLRENDEPVLLGACMDVRDIEFTRDFVIVTAHNETVHRILKKHISTLNKYAGGEYIQVIPSRPKPHLEEIKKNLQLIFGDKLKIEVK